MILGLNKATDEWRIQSLTNSRPCYGYGWHSFWHGQKALISRGQCGPWGRSRRGWECPRGASSSLTFVLVWPRRPTPLSSRMVPGEIVCLELSSRLLSLLDHCPCMSSRTQGRPSSWTIVVHPEILACVSEYPALQNVHYYDRPLSRKD
jgi:hypothetical protein